MVGERAPEPASTQVPSGASLAWERATLSGILPYLSGYETPSNYYEYQDGKITPDTNLTNQTFTSGYPTYLLSPSGNKTFWSVYADGKNNLRVGDQSGQGAKTISGESDYSPYGWFGDGYLLVSKNSSELYIMAADGSSRPYKISNYYKPQVSYRGYGGLYVFVECMYVCM